MSYLWLHNPDPNTSPPELVEDITLLVREQEKISALAQALGLGAERLAAAFDAGISLHDFALSNNLDPNHVSSMAEEIERQPKLAARVELAAGRHMAKLAGVAEGGLRLWAINASQSGLYRYHDEEFDTVEAMFQAALDDIPRTSTTWFDLNTIATVIYPFAKAHGIEGVETIWQEGHIANARAAVPLLRKVATKDGAPTADELAAAQQVVADVLHLTMEQWKAHYGRTSTSVPVMLAWDYKGKVGGTLVIEYETEAQLLKVQRRLEGGIDLHFGDGAEPVLGLLAKIRARRKRRK